MGSFSVWHWAIFATVLLILAVPGVRMLKRLGFSGWWVVLAFIPWLNIVGLWVIAFVPWPCDQVKSKKS